MLVASRLCVLGPAGPGWASSTLIWSSAVSEEVNVWITVKISSSKEWSGCPARGAVTASGGVP